MKSVSVALAAHLAQSATTLATCWKLKRRDGVVLGFTEHDLDIVFDLGPYDANDSDGAVTYSASNAYARASISSSAEFNVDDLDIVGVLDSAAITAPDIRAGRYDFAEVKIFEVNWADLSQGPLKLRRGDIGEITVKDGAFVGELRGLLQRYAQPIGDLYGPACRVDLGSTKCGVRADPPVWQPFTAYSLRQARDGVTGSVVKPTVFNDRHFVCTTAGVSASGEPAWNTTLGGTTNDGAAVWTAIQALTIEATVAAVVNNREFSIDYLGSASEQLLTGGLVTFLDSVSPTPANVNLKKEVKLYAISPPTVILTEPMPFTVAIGDPLTITAGCAKTVAACRDLFDNIENYRGEPYIPGNDLLFKTPDAR